MDTQKTIAEDDVLRKLLTGIEVAQILNISNAQAYNLMREGKIPTIKFGRSVRVRIEDLRSFIECNLTMNSGSQDDLKCNKPVPKLLAGSEIDNE